MHFFSRRNASLALSLAAVGVLAACGDDVVVPVAPAPPVTVSITPQAVSLNPGASATLSVQIAGGSPTPTLQSCSTGASSVATAAVAGGNCTVTAVAPGATTITATTSAGQSASAAVTVNSLPSAINGDLSVSPSTAAISVGQQVTLVPSLNLGGAGVTTAYTYDVQPAGIVSLSGTGNNRTVTAVSAGVATVTVSVTATGAGFTSATRTAAVTVNVTAAPPALTGLTVSPTALTIPTGGAGQLTASVTQPAGATAATLSFTSSNTSVATVSGTGATRSITAVAPGNATITVTATAAATSTLSAATLTQLVQVTVAPLPVVSIEAVTQGPIVTTGLDTAYSGVVGAGTLAGGPTGPDQGVIAGIRQALNPQLDQSVDIANTKDQIQVRLNLATNGATVDSVVVYINPATTAGRRAAARQINPQAGQLVTGYINTADFTPNATTGIGEVFYTNGLKEISASVWITLPAGSPASACPTAIQANNACEIQNAANNRQSFNFNNIDGFALTMTNPANSALDANQRTWWGGPTVSDIGQPAGHVTFQVWPVIYTPNRTIERLNATFGRCQGFGTGGLPNGVEKVGAPYVFTVGTAAPAGSTATHIGCGGLTGAYDGRDNFRFEDYPMVTYSLDNSANPGPRSIYAYNPSLGTDVFAGPRPSLFRQSAQVQSPNAIRVDYLAPTMTLTAPSVQERWVSVNYAFSSNLTTDDANSGAASGSFPGPVGVGRFATAQRTPPRMNFLLASRNVCGGPQSFTVFGNGIGTTSNDIASLVTPLEHPCDFTNDAYSLAATEVDLLGNRRTTTTTVASGAIFGVDTAPPSLTAAYDGSGPIPDMPDFYAAPFVGAAPALAADTVGIFQGGGTGNATPIAKVAGANPTDFYFGARYRDTRSGFNISNHGSRIVRRFRPNATPLLTNRAVIDTVSSRTMNFAGGFGNPVENEDPTFRRDSVTIYGFGPISGTSAGTALVNSPATGYYQYDVVLRDRAGNSSTLRQRAVIDNTSPVITGVQLPAVFGATGTGMAVQQAVRPTGTDDVEAFDSDIFMRYPALGMIGDSTVNSTVAAGAARLRFRRNTIANWHNPWMVFEDTLLSTPFGPGAALSDAGMTLPIPTIRGLEATDSTDSPVQWSAVSPVTSATVLRDFVGFKPNQLGIYAFDVRASKQGAWLAPYAADPSYANHGMTNMFASTVLRPGVGNGEAAYRETIFAGNVSNGTRWETKDFGTPATGFQGLVTWAGFSSTSTSVSFRATTNSVSTQPIFPRTYLVRWEADAQVTGSGYAASDLALNDSVPGQWVYIGELVANAPTNPALFDQGSARVWQYTFTFGAVTNGRIVQSGTNTNGCYRAIGVDASGDGIATKPFSVGGAVCPTLAAVAGTNTATVTLRAFGPGAGTIQHTAGAPVMGTLTKSTGSNGLVRLSANLNDVAQTFVITPSGGSTLQVAPTGCTTLSAATYPTTAAVTCTVHAGFGSRHITAIFDTPSIP